MLYSDDEYLAIIDLLQERTDEPQQSTDQKVTLSEHYDKEQDGKGSVDRQGNPLNSDGSLYIEEVASVDDISDVVFEEPTRTIALANVPQNVREVIGAGHKPIIIKKNIYEKNMRDHKDLPPAQSREILGAVLYTPNLYGQNQKT